MHKNERHTDEYKDANKKTVVVDGEEKLLLMDDEEGDEEINLSENELAEVIALAVESALQELF